MGSGTEGSRGRVLAWAGRGVAGEALLEQRAGRRERCWKSRAKLGPGEQDFLCLSAWPVLMTLKRRDRSDLCGQVRVGLSPFRK